MKLPGAGSVLQLRTVEGRALNLIDVQSMSLDFVLGRGADFQVHRGELEAAGDPRRHAVLAFELVGHGCFLGISAGKIACVAAPLARDGWFLVHASGELQHFVSGLYLSDGPQGACLLEQEEDAAQCRWPVRILFQGWLYASSRNMLALVAVFIVIAALTLYLPRDAVEPLLHMLHVSLQVGCLTSFWLNEEVVGFIVVFAALLLGLVWGRMRRTPNSGIGMVVICGLLACVILRRAYATKDPLFTAVAYVFLASLAICALSELVLTGHSIFSKWAVAPSRTLAACVFPAVLACTLFAAASGHAPSWQMVALRGAALLSGAGHVAWVGPQGPRQQRRRPPELPGVQQQQQQ